MVSLSPVAWVAQWPCSTCSRLSPVFSLMFAPPVCCPAAFVAPYSPCSFWDLPSPLCPPSPARAPVPPSPRVSLRVACVRRHDTAVSPRVLRVPLQGPAQLLSAAPAGQCLLALRPPGGQPQCPGLPLPPRCTLWAPGDWGPSLCPAWGLSRGAKPCSGHCPRAGPAWTALHHPEAPDRSLVCPALTPPLGLLGLLTDSHRPAAPHTGPRWPLASLL